MVIGLAVTAFAVASLAGRRLADHEPTRTRRAVVGERVRSRKGITISDIDVEQAPNTVVGKGLSSKGKTEISGVRIGKRSSKKR